MCVYLRVKPKTPEETEFYTCSDEVDMANMEDENFEVVTIESTHQVCFKFALSLVALPVVFFVRL